MRIMLVVPGGVDPPGSERVIPFIHDLVARLAAQHQVDILAIGHDPLPGQWLLHGCRVVNVPIGAHSRADLVAALRAAHREFTPRPDVVHGLWAGASGLIAASLGRRHRVPSVVTLCGGELAAVPEIGYGGALTKGSLTLARTALRLATTTTAATEWMVRHAAQAGVHVDEIVPLGADPALFRPGRAIGTGLIQIGSLNAVKDQELALRAFQRVLVARPEATFTLAGVDTMNGRHARLAAELGIASSVHFTGFLHPPALVQHLQAASVHLTASWHEAGPLAVVEAALCEVPTVGTAVGHVADLAGGDAPAAVVVDRDATAIAAAVVELLDRPDERTLLGQRARRWAMAHSADHTALAFEAIYRRLAARSSSRAAASTGDDPRRRT